MIFVRPLGMVACHGNDTVWRIVPGVGATETRSMTVPQPMLDDDGDVILPADEYGFAESYCVDPDCDCRSTLIHVLARNTKAHVASISYDFDPDSDDASERYKQTSLDPVNRQSEWADAILVLFVEQILANPAYRQRLVHHYQIVKLAAADPSHPCQPLVRQALRQVSETFSSVRRSPIPPPPRRGKRKWR